MESQKTTSEEHTNGHAETNSNNNENVVLDEWTCRANDVINLRLVQSREDLQNSSTIFHPLFTHQIYEGKDENHRETISGFKGLQINLYHTAAGLRTFINYTATEQQSSGNDPTLPILQARKKDTSPIIRSLDEFVKIAEEEQHNFKPVGSQVHSYKLEKHINANQDITYEIYQGFFTDDKVRNYHSKIEPFVFWFIDGSSALDSSDTNWEIFFIFENNRVHGESVYRAVGYSTVYKFYNYPDKIRKRISQVLILPPFHKQGHAVHLLETIYNCSKSAQVRDITVEEPNLDFGRIRDYVDIRNIVKFKLFPATPTKPLEQEQILKIQEQLHISIKQIKHLYDMWQFKHTNVNDPKDYKNFRIQLKKKLYKEYQDALGGCTPEEKKEELAKLYDSYEKEFRAVLKRIDLQ